VDLRAGLDDLKKRKFLTPPGLELRLLSRPALCLLIPRKKCTNDFPSQVEEIALNLINKIRSNHVSIIKFIFCYFLKDRLFSVFPFQSLADAGG
jgi:hypothetical protein